MTLILNLENGLTATTNVAETFTENMINECFLGKDYEGFGIVKSIQKSLVRVY